jgi:hypothetical protein
LHPYLDLFFDHCAEATTTLLVRDGRTDARVLNEWIATLLRMGWSEQRVNSILGPYLVNQPYWPWAFASYGVTPRLDLPFLIPNPLYDAPAHLGEAMIEILRSRGELERLSFEGFVLAVFSAAAFVTGVVSPLPIRAAEAGWRTSVYHQAIVWLFGELPTVPLNTAAGQALDSYPWPS